MGRIRPAAEHHGGGHGRLVVERPFCLRVGKGRAVPRVSPLGVSDSILWIRPAGDLDWIRPYAHPSS